MTSSATQSLRVHLARAAALRDALCAPITYKQTITSKVRLELDCPRRFDVSLLRRACTDPLAVLRDRRIARSVPRMIPRFVSARPLPAAAGMALAAIAREQPSSTPESLLRILSTEHPDEGPRRIGIGVLSPLGRSLLALFTTILAIVSVVALVVTHPSLTPWVVGTATVGFATRPDRDSFLAWARACAPKVAERKKIIGDKIRARLAPYVMRFRPLYLNDYGLFSVVTFKDHADYVYVYAGFLSRWCLLGWYNVQDDYNFDKILTVR